MIVKFVEKGSSIEGSSTRLATRKISRTPIFVRIQKIDGTFLELYKYKTNRRATITIIKELSPKRAMIEQTSKLDLHSTLEAGAIEIYTKNRFNIKLFANFTSTHTIQGDTISSFTFAKIIIPWQFALERG